MDLSKLTWLKKISYPVVKTFAQNHWKAIGGIAGLVLGGGLLVEPSGPVPHISLFTAIPSANGATLQWEVEAATEVRLNDIPMDTNGEILIFPDRLTTYKLVAVNELGEDTQTIQVKMKDSAPVALTFSPQPGDKIFSQSSTKKSKPQSEPQPTIVKDSGSTNESVSTVIARFSNILWKQEGKSQAHVQDAMNECIAIFRQQNPGARTPEACMLARNYQRP